ncbi:4Fe-4S double cluster binding domain-containing protein [Chloroflexota bacterium]
MEKTYKAMPIPATQQLDKEKNLGIFSNKIAASLSGQGWIGKSCLLITDDKGPRVRWGTVLTDAPLKTGKPMKVKCGKCTKCIEACPVGAFTGRNFNPSEPREKRMLASKCKDFTEARRGSTGFHICGMCVYVCPFGKPKGGRK